MISAMTAPITRAPPTSARRPGISWNASHTQNGMSGVSRVAIKSHEAGQADPEDIGTGARIADDNYDAAERRKTGQQGWQSDDFSKPYPGQCCGDEWSCCDDDRYIRHAGQLQNRDETHHAQGRQRRNQPTALFHPGQILHAGSTLQHHQNGRDDAPAEQPSPKQYGPGVEGKQPCEKRCRTPGHGGSDNKSDARAMLRMSRRHKGNPVSDTEEPDRKAIA